MSCLQTCFNGGQAGYVLACLPSFSEEYLKVQEQIDLIKNLKMPPDFIINIKVPLYYFIILKLSKLISSSVNLKIFS